MVNGKCRGKDGAPEDRWKVIAVGGKKPVSATVAAAVVVKARDTARQFRIDQEQQGRPHCYTSLVKARFV
ncbi:unnamed protein product [Enterobius vermicularis]|uniref:DUF2188 domain-containing protein n=1 Tax=Enterobius vermicularis TaxID=51028 RepID=A0A0N4VG86_ENTVE|nr:unnamed protein product [Enterobius vermicularis]